jgi:hypothetical protein
MPLRREGMMLYIWPENNSRVTTGHLIHLPFGSFLAGCFPLWYAWTLCTLSISNAVFAGSRTIRTFRSTNAEYTNTRRSNETFLLSIPGGTTTRTIGAATRPVSSLPWDPTFGTISRSHMIEVALTLPSITTSRKLRVRFGALGMGRSLP